MKTRACAVLDRGAYSCCATHFIRLTHYSSQICHKNWQFWTHGECRWSEMVGYIGEVPRKQTKLRVCLDSFHFSFLVFECQTRFSHYYINMIYHSPYKRSQFLLSIYTHNCLFFIVNFNLITSVVQHARNVSTRTAATWEHMENNLGDVRLNSKKWNPSSQISKVFAKSAMSSLSKQKVPITKLNAKKCYTNMWFQLWLSDYSNFQSNCKHK